MMINSLEMDYVGKHSSFAINQSGYIDSYLLAANVARSAIVPTGAGKVFFGVTPIGTPFYVNQNAAATVATADVTDGSASELCPEGRKCTPGETISIISASNCVVTLAYYK